MDENTKQLLNLLYIKCHSKDKSNYIFYHILELLITSNVVDIDNDYIDNMGSLIPNKYSINNISFSERYHKDFNELKEIGRGGYGVVYLGENKIDKMLYAIKKIYLNIEDNHNINLSLNEIYILSRLNHKNIVRYNTAWIEPFSINGNINKSIENKYFESNIDLLIENNKNINVESYDNSLTKSYTNSEINSYNKNTRIESHENSLIESDENSLIEFDKLKNTNLYIIFYIQMEYCPGRNLKYYLMHRKDLELLNNLNIIYNIIEGIEYLHKQNIVHFDLKPANIFLNKNNIKIGDFGLSKTKSNNNTKSNEGTLLYCDPNIKKNNKNKKAMDIYSIGIIIIELFVIFKTDMEKYGSLRNPIIYLNSNNTIDKDIKKLILNCINNDINKRFNILQIKRYLFNKNNILINNDNFIK